MSETEVYIYYEDTDIGGVVYYANYLRYFERARTKAMIERGVDPAEWAKKGVVFTVVRAEVDYKSPATYGDTLIVKTGISDVKGPRLTFTYEVTDKRDGRLIALGKTGMACVGEGMRPRRIPDEIVERIA
ncbi:MAG: acyl-CoA thioesterase [Candidatus Nitrospinota bacterium M3_3B_026]